MNIQFIEQDFQNSFFVLDDDEIHYLNKGDHGQINNVIIGLNKECFGLRLFEESEKEIIIELFYITYKTKLEGELIRISLNNPYYTLLLLRFCIVLAIKHKQINEIDTYNTYQNHLRTALEKEGYFTVTNIEIDELKTYGGNGTIYSIHHKGIKRIDLIPKIEFYREVFNGNYDYVSKNISQYVYLMINTNTSLIKIGFSKNPKYRERTLHSQEPEVHLIACWNGDRNIEAELHKKFKDKRIRGEYFRLSFQDLHILRDFMEERSIKTDL